MPIRWMPLEIGPSCCLSSTWNSAVLGLTGYYRKFIKGYAELALPLYKLLTKGVPFSWGEEHQKSFVALRKAVIDKPILMLPRRSEPYDMHTEASDFAIGAVSHNLVSHKVQEANSVRVTQIDSGSKPICYTRKRTVSRSACTQSVEYLPRRGACPSKKTDHAALEWFNTQPKLTQRQKRWSVEMHDNDVHFLCVPGKSDVVADALSRRPVLQVTNHAIRLRRRSHQGALADCGPQAAHLTEESTEIPVPRTLFDSIRSTCQETSFDPHDSLTSTFLSGQMACDADSKRMAVFESSYRRI
jgi:hypothetical protein